MANLMQSADPPTVQGEGDYEAARRYREKLADFVKHEDVEQLAKSANVSSAKDARELALAEESARLRSRGDDPADVGIMYHQQTLAEDRSVAEKAYELWQARGCPHGSSDIDWYEAERLLSASTDESANKGAASSIDE